MIRVAVALLALLVAGCATTPRTLEIESKDLIKTGTAKLRKVNCSWRLGKVEDLRSEESGAGALGATRIEISDVDVLLAELLRQRGVGAEAGATMLDLRVHKLYMRQQHEIRVPTAVIEVMPHGSEPFVVRVQDASAYWSGSDEGTTRGFSRMLDEAVDVLVLRLNDRCRSPVEGQVRNN